MLSLFIILGIMIMAVNVLIGIIIIRAICNYQAKQNAAHFDYDYLAERTAEEICQRMIVLEKQKTKTESKETTEENEQ